MRMFLFSVVFAGVALAQPPDSLWTRFFDNGDAESCYGISETADQGLIIAGRAFLETNSAAILIKVDPLGFPFWSQTYGHNEIANAAVQTPDGGFVAAGTTFGNSNPNFWIMKVSSNGDSIWSRTFGGTASDVCYSMTPTVDGGFLLAGYTNSFGAGRSDFWAVKTDASGGGLWTRTFGSSGNEVCNSVARTSDGGYVLAGQTDSLAVWGGINDCWLVKVNAQGDTLWTRAFGGSGEEFFHSVVQSAEGGYIAAGATTSNTAGLYDCFVVKTDVNGNAIWARQFGGAGDDQVTEVAALSDGGCVTSGPSNSFGMNGTGTWILRLDALGDTLWSKTILPDTIGYGFCGTLLADGGYAFGGGGFQRQTGEFDIMVTKIGAIPLATPSHLNFAPAEFALIGYPNPFNPVTNLTFTLDRRESATLFVYDVQGRNVRTLVDGPLAAGDHSIPFDAAGLPSGLYFSRLNVGSRHSIYKLVLMK